MTDTKPAADTRTTDDTPRQQIRETGSLVGDALTQVTSLMRGEMDLFRAEIDQNVKEAGAGLGMIVGGVVIMLVALNVLASALVVALTEIGIDAGWSALIVGISLAVIAAILAKSGTGKLKTTSLAPTRTAKNVRRDGEAVKKAI
ncbi:phage holin family protein [Palleronia rufa]|uniref:phage holin family protein n=1 Tax=Palleronia rufa TaxID=1530186 RepID=UPI0009DF56B3|nr:phage holin family protein [Palleronia rufa]